MEDKKSIKRHLKEIFLKMNYVDCENKKELIIKDFKHDLKWALGFLIFLLISYILVLIFGA